MFTKQKLTTNGDRYPFHPHPPPLPFLPMSHWVSSNFRSVSTLFLRSDAKAILFFSTPVFVWLPFEGSVYFFGTPKDINYSWIRYVRVIQWRLLDTVNSKWSLSVLLSAMETSRTTQTAPVLVRWLSSEITRIRMCMCVTYTSHGNYLRMPKFTNTYGICKCGYALAGCNSSVNHWYTKYSLWTVITKTRYMRINSEHVFLAGFAGICMWYCHFENYK